jgi:hypothetical protein
MKSDRGAFAHKLDYIAGLPSTVVGRRNRERQIGTEAMAEVDREVAKRLGVKIRPAGDGVHWTRRYAGELLDRGDVLVLLRTAGPQLDQLLAAGRFPKPRNFDSHERWTLSTIFNWTPKRQAA